MGSLAQKWELDSRIYNPTHIINSKDPHHTGITTLDKTSDLKSQMSFILLHKPRAVIFSETVIPEYNDPIAERR